MHTNNTIHRTLHVHVAMYSLNIEFVLETTAKQCFGEKTACSKYIAVLYTPLLYPVPRIAFMLQRSASNFNIRTSGRNKMGVTFYLHVQYTIVVR